MEAQSSLETYVSIYKLYGVTFLKAEIIILHLQP
jgi:hypothetical protein